MNECHTLINMGSSLLKHDWVRDQHNANASYILTIPYNTTYNVLTLTVCACVFCVRIARARSMRGQPRGIERLPRRKRGRTNSQLLLREYHHSKKRGFQCFLHLDVSKTRSRLVCVLKDETLQSLAFFCHLHYGCIDCR